MEGDYNAHNAGKCSGDCGYLVANVDEVHAEGSGLISFQRAGIRARQSANIRE
jgi:hypothetical protein